MTTPNKPPQEEPIIYESEPAANDTQSWYEYMWKTEQETPKRLEDTAKFITGLASICITIAVRVGDPQFKGTLSTVGTLILFSSLLAAFFVAFSHDYIHQKHSVESYKAMQQKIIIHKQKLLFVAKVLFLCGLFLLMAAFWVAGLK